jgi:hypothetical protein
MSDKMRPFFPYYGSKWNLSRYYPAPTRELVIEPFAGSAGYSTFYGVEKALLIDSDPIIVGVWDYLMNVSPDEILALPELPNAGDNVDDLTVPQEAKWLIGFWLNRGSATPKRTRTAYSTRSDKAQLTWGARAKNRIASQLGGIRNWEVRQGDYTEAPFVEATWLIDPPYVDKGKYYRHSFDDFDALAGWAMSREGQSIVCEGAGADWLPFQPLGNFKTSSGSSPEVVFLSDKRDTCPDCGSGHDVALCDGGLCDCCASIERQKEAA